MSTFQSEVLSALDSFNDQWKEAKASTGGAQRPPKGEWDNYIKSIKVTKDDSTSIRYKDANGKEATFPGIAVDFTYCLLGGTSAIPPEMKQGQEWPGRRFIIPVGGPKALPASFSDGHKKAFVISSERLKGHLTTILGKGNPILEGPLSASLGAAIAKVGDPTAPNASLVVVRVKCEYRTDDNNPDRTYFDEYLQRLISG